VTVLQAIYDEEIAGGILVADVPGSKKVVPKGCAVQSGWFQ
jgi:hypothetical protein